jgi:hypothetical protein
MADTQEATKIDPQIRACVLLVASCKEFFAEFSYEPPAAPEVFKECLALPSAEGLEYFGRIFTHAFKGTPYFGSRPLDRLDVSMTFDEAELKSRTQDASATETTKLINGLWDRIEGEIPVIDFEVDDRARCIGYYGR